MPRLRIDPLRPQPVPSLRFHRRTPLSSFLRRVFITGFPLAALVACPPQCKPQPRQDARPVEGRLVGIAWAPYHPRPGRLPRMRRRPAEGSAAVPTTAVRRSAIAALCNADPDLAIRELQAAAEQAPRHAALWSDLTAAYLSRAEARSDPHDLVLALAAATRATKRDPGLTEARFNLALALEHFGLRAQAIREWGAVLRLENDHDWAHEARIRLAILTSARPSWTSAKAHLVRAAATGDRRALRSLITEWPQDCREYLENEVLEAWSAAKLAHDDVDAARSLALARAIAQQRAELTGERLDQEAVAQIERSRLPSVGASRVDLLAQGIQAYGEGLALIRQESFTPALAPLQSALRILSAQGSPLAGWASFQIGYCHYQRYEYDKALRFLLPLTHDPRDRPGALGGRAFWFVGLVHLIRGDLTAALGALTTASSIFHRLGEKSNESMVGALLATSLASLGQQTESWRVLHAALRDPPAAPRMRSGFYGMAAFIAVDDGEFEAALRLQDEMLRSANEAGVAVAVAEGLFDRAYILITLGDTSGAASTLDEALRTLPHIPDPRTRRLTEGNLLLAKGRLLVPTAPLTAVQLLDHAIAILRATGSHWPLGQALFQRAVAERSLDRTDDAQRDLAEAIAESERQRESITPIEQRISYLDQKRSLIEAMVSFQLAKGSPAEALSYSERARARVLADWIEDQPAAPRVPEAAYGVSRFAPLEHLRQQLPEDWTVVEYWLERDRLDLWVMSRSQLETRHVLIAANSLEELVLALNQAIAQADDTAALRASTTLYDALIRPAAGLLSPGRRLVFVPDGPLHALSFALLRDSRTGRYLVQDHPFSVTPSARIFVDCLRRDRQLAVARQPRALLVVDPAFDEQLYPSLPRLAGGRTEQLIPRSLPGSRVLRDAQATKSAFLAAAGNFEIVHFGGHALLNPRYPLLSQLVFAKAPASPDRGVLYSGEILGRHLARTRLVVLASCSTAAGRVSRTEGIESIARPFLAAGVPAIIASLWPVDDDTTAELFHRFYHSLVLQPDVTEALRIAQLEALEHGSERMRRPSSWGAFELIGSGSPFRPRPPVSHPPR
jgi:CHAT domain-containing protein